LLQSEAVADIGTNPVKRREATHALAILLNSVIPYGYNPHFA